MEGNGLGKAFWGSPGFLRSGMVVSPFAMLTVGMAWVVALTRSDFVLTFRTIEQLSQQKHYFGILRTPIAIEMILSWGTFFAVGKFHVPCVES